MGIVNAGFSISLDGFVAGPDDGPEQPLGRGGSLLVWQWRHCIHDAQWRRAQAVRLLTHLEASR